jgi:HEAT repeat protein
LLGWLAAPDALPDLIEALGCEDDALRQAAVEGLLRFGHTALPHLLAALDHRQALVRESAVELLGMLSDASVVPRLLEHRGDAALAVRQALVRALGSLGGEAAYHGLLQALLAEETRDTALGVIGQLRQPDLVNYLQHCLYEDASPVRWAAAQALSLIGGEAAVSILLNAIRLPDDQVRQPAAEALGRVRSNQAVPVLLEALGDRDWLVRQKAVEALGNIADGRAVTALLLLQREPEWRVRRTLVSALARVADSRVTPALRVLAEDPNRWVRRAVMELGAEVSDSRMLDLLIQGLADAEPSVRQAALVTLGRRREPVAAAAVAGGLSDSDTLVRLAAVHALTWIDPALASARLADLVQSEPESIVRQAAADALGELGVPEVVAPLAALLGDPVPAVSARAAEALALVGTGPALEALAAGLQLSGARDHILVQFERLGVPAIRALLACARAAEAAMRAAAAQALGVMGHSLALPTLRLLVRDADERVRAAAAAALAAIPPYSS